MSLSIAINDERALSKEMLILGLGGVTAGFTAGGLSLIAGEYVPQLMVLTFAAVVGLFANYGDRMRERGHFRLGLSVLAGVLWALLLPVGAVWAAVVGGAVLGASIYGGTNDGREVGLGQRLAVAGLYGVGMLLAVFTTQTFIEIGFLSDMTSTIVPEIVMGSTWGAFLCAVAVASRVEFKRDVLVADYKAAISEVDYAGCMTLTQGLTIYSKLMAEFERSEDRAFVEVASPVAQEVAKNLLVLVRRTDALRSANVADDFIQLEARIARVEAELESAEDGALIGELHGVREELRAQLNARLELRATSARFEARQQRCITSLERLQIALIQNSTLGMEHVDLQGALGSLQDLAEEIRWRSGWDVEQEVGGLERGLVGERAEIAEIQAVEGVQA